jgi:endonuclease/exonuclease/phosphatase family metal-dependent hydrolase
MKLLQLNIWQGRLRRSMLKFLEAEEPDIICLQEVTSSEIPSYGFLELNNLEFLLEKLKYPYHTFAPRFSYEIMRSKGFYGNAILSRLPIVSEEVRYTHGSFEENVDFRQKRPNMFNAQRAAIDVNGRELQVLNHHGYHDVDPNGVPEAIESAQKLADWISELSGPVVLAGDLNVWPASPAIQPLNKILRNLTVENGVLSTLTQFGAAEGVACDYIFASEEVNVKEFKVSEELVSDHKALILEFDL